MGVRLWRPSENRMRIIRRCAPSAPGPRPALRNTGIHAGGRRALAPRAVDVPELAAHHERPANRNPGTADATALSASGRSSLRAEVLRLARMVSDLQNLDAVGSAALHQARRRCDLAGNPTNALNTPPSGTASKLTPTLNSAALVASAMRSSLQAAGAAPYPCAARPPAGARQLLGAERPEVVATWRPTRALDPERSAVPGNPARGGRKDLDISQGSPLKRSRRVRLAKPWPGSRWSRPLAHRRSRAATPRSGYAAPTRWARPR
jgi:hypothetical protein